MERTGGIQTAGIPVNSMMSRQGRSPQEVLCPQCRTNRIKLFLADSENPPAGIQCDSCRRKEIEATASDEEKQDIAAVDIVKRNPQGFQTAIVKERGVPRQYTTCSFGNWEGQAPSTTPGIIIGKTGVGKTHMAVAIMKRWIANHTDISQTPRRSVALSLLAETAKCAIFIPTIMLVWEMRAKTGNKAENIDEAMHAYCHYDFAIIDDLGAERQTEWSLEVLTRLIYERHAEQKETVFTSNLSMSQIAETFGDRTASRILDFGRPFEITSLVDWRKKRPMQINEKQEDDAKRREKMQQ
jgi:DNA replication protein DnaC